MSEHSPPHETVTMLNEYFEIMADCVFAYQGIAPRCRSKAAAPC